MLPPESTNRPPKERLLPSTPDDGAPRPRLDPSLRVENILLKEFDYAGLAAYQVYENRERVSNFYFTIIGALLSGLGALYQFSRTTNTDWRPLAVGLLIAGGLLSAIFFVRLIHLRQSLRDSIITTHVIKEFYIQQFIDEIPNIEQAFRWRLATIPSGERPSSDTSFVVYPIAGLGSIAFGAATLIADQLRLEAHGAPLLSAMSAGQEPWIAGALVGAVVAFFQWAFYHWKLSAQTELKILEQQAGQLGITLGKANERQNRTLVERVLPWNQEPHEDLR